MKKIIIASAAASLILTAIGTCVNIIGFRLYGNAPLATEYVGGEVIGSIGFGISIYTVYPLALGDAAPKTVVEFVPGDFIYYFVVIFVIVLIPLLLIRVIRNRKNAAI